jgi:predicted RNase H-like HicB family nuclease
MHRYTVLLYPEPEGGYSAVVPSLPGCFTQGETVDEALANAREAAEVWLEDARDLGEDIPEEAAVPIIAAIEFSELATSGGR